MKIMVCGLRGFPDVQGGVETHCQNLYPLLAAQGCEVTVIARKGFQNEAISHWKGVDFTDLWCPKISSLEAIVHSLLAVFYAAIKRPDILHIHAIGPALVTPIARLFGLKAVVTHHGPDYEREKWGPFAERMLRLGEKSGMRCSERRIVISKVIQDLVQDKYQLSSDLIPNGVIIPELKSGQDKIEQFGLQSGKYVLMVSRIVPEKRHLDLIQAFVKAGLEGWKLVLVGNDDHQGEYEARVLEMAGNYEQVLCTGKQSGVTLEQLYTHAGVFVLPSSHEGLPIALLEALSFGLPCIASDIPANLCVGLEPQYYFKLGDTGELSAKLEEYAAKPWGKGVREGTRKWVNQRFDWADISEATLSVYEQTVAGENR